MIKDIIRLLNADDYLIKDPDIDFAKGIDKIPQNIKEMKRNIKRRYGR